MFCKESLGKNKFRTFPKRVGPRILSPQQANTAEWSKKKPRILISKTAMVGCCKLSLHANGFCDEHAVYFRFIFSGIEALEFSCIYPRV